MVSFFVELSVFLSIIQYDKCVKIVTIVNTISDIFILQKCVYFAKAYNILLKETIVLTEAFWLAFVLAFQNKCEEIHK